MYKVVLTKTAEKFYAATSSDIARKINKAIEVIKKSPYSHSNIKKLKGNLSGYFRYRIGEYRIIYSVGEEIKIVSIIWIGKRQDAYK
jgi:mRNA interferase RelE/StbE